MNLKDKARELIEKAKTSIEENREDEEAWYEFEVLRKKHPVSDARFMEAASPTSITTLMTRYLKMEATLEKIGYMPDGSKIIGTSNRSAAKNFSRVAQEAREALKEVNCG